MIHGAIYRKTDGRITMGVIATDEAGISAQVYGQEDELAWLIADEKVECELHCVVDGAIANRPPFPGVFPASDEIAVNQVWAVTNLPNNTRVIHAAGAAIVNDGHIEWSCIEPGQYRFMFDCFPYRMITKTVTVVA